MSTVGGIIATVQDPNSFDSFHDSNGNFQQFLPFFETTGEGSFCINIDLASSGISGVKDRFKRAPMAETGSMPSSITTLVASSPSEKTDPVVS